MAFGKRLLTFSTLTMMVMIVAFALPVHSSLTRFQGGRKLVEEAATTTPSNKQGFEAMFLDKGESSSSSSSSSSKVVVVVDVEDSAREVPTGPDPLHHNNKPIKP